jgi:hypothetical protein
MNTDMVFNDVSVSQLEMLLTAATKAIKLRPVEKATKDVAPAKGKGATRKKTSGKSIKNH